jgi:large subunit ribosomal protein L15
MKLNDIRPARGAVKKRKRIACGTGSGHGKTATRGMKGQKSRSGGGMPPWFEGGQMPLQRRVPKRGFTNIFKTSYQVVNIDRLNGFEKGTKIDRESLQEAGLVKKLSRPVKILGKGELNVALEIEVDAVSASAAKAIRDAGGTVKVASESKPRAASEKPGKTGSPRETTGSPRETTGSTPAEAPKIAEQPQAPAETAEEKPVQPADVTDEKPSAPADAADEGSETEHEAADETPEPPAEATDAGEEDRRE